MSDQQHDVPSNQQSPEATEKTEGVDTAMTATGFPIVGIGASAGGLAAFEAFFAGMPADKDPDMAFVLVQHLAPDHDSLLVEILGRCTRMPVFEAEDGMPVKPNCVYVIPPNYEMELMNGTLVLVEPTVARGHRLPIDYFFRSLARDQHQRSIGIILSGSASDGAQGVRAIKSEAGMVIAQTPESAEFDSMPRSAIRTGMVDYQLAPGDMPAKLLSYVSMAFGKLPGRLDLAIEAQPSDSSMKKIFAALRTTIGHDFSHYKPSTIQRRIERRMAVQQIDSIENYVKYLQQSPIEVEALFRDLLIGVTNFFRDPDAFLALEQQVISKLVSGSFLPRGVIRVWICGCSTGEEAYSIAILLREYQDATDTQFAIQVFATDIDSRAIATARAGVYPLSIANDITPERLATYFRLEPNEGGYRIRKDIREMMVFSEHDINKDPPFSKLDLISCRNLLIYFGADLQRKLIPLFHFALNKDGYLFLGTSEGIGEFNDLFATLDRKSKLFQRKPGLSILQNSVPSRFAANVTASGSAPTKFSGQTKLMAPIILPLRELMERTLLQQWAPAAALVNASGDIFYLHGRTGMFLEPSAGEVGVNNILKMAREGLHHELSMALQKVVVARKIVRVLGLAVKTNGHFTRANLVVGPVSTSHSLASDPTDSHFYVVMMEEVSEPPAAATPIEDKVTDSNANGSNATGANLTSDAENVIAALRAELRIRDEYIQSAREELESSNEELKSSNEEMQSVNEELQSTNEELETSREEMQSINEELATVNAELQSKVVDLTQINDDMNNLLAGTGIATVFVDRNLRIMRFTPTVAQLINLIPTDIGRPVGHIVSNLVNYNSLPVDAQAVLDSLKSHESPVQTANGAWFMMRICPYRTQENVIEGVVITFVDITEAKRIEDALAKANEQLRLAIVVRDSYDAITVQDLDGRIIAWNPGAVRIYGWSEAEALQMNVRERIPEPLRKDCLMRVYQLIREERIAPYDTQRITKSGAILDVCMTVTALLNEFGQTYAIATTERVIKPVAEVGR